ncbi:MAG: AMP-binding protein [Pseudomonadales bacterium]|nr:AMP-binding protein [Pseudomonadales bacterium]MCP5183245.1 AMP-binding protein [Pseudomonadales bacterium]
MTLFCGRQAEKRANAIAVSDERGERTWQQLDERANRLLNRLRAEGLDAGDVIAVFAGNCTEYFDILMAATHGGLLCVPVNWHFSAEELAYVVADSGARWLFVEDRFAQTARDAVKEHGMTAAGVVQIRGDATGFTPYEEWLAGGAPDEPENQVMGGPMFYTSGTTGRPKGVRSSTSAKAAPLATLDMMSQGLSGMLGIPSDGTTLLCGPVYHSAQWAFSFLPLIAGSRVVMRHRFEPAETLALIDTHKVTNVHLVPTQFHRLLRLPDDVRAAFDGGSLQIVWHGAAPCPPGVKRAMIDWWGPIVSEYYGSTEGSIVSTASAGEWQERPGTVGKPSPLVEITIRDDSGNVLPAGEHGQIYVKNRMGTDFEYHNAPDKTRDVHLEPGVFTFGDIGYFDADGYLYLSDRKIDMIISGGVNIYPAEIEGVLATHPAVRDAAVFGIPNEEFGEEVKAAVTLNDGYAAGDGLAAELVQWVRDHLAGYKAPRSIDFETDMPRHETGKLYKRLLRDRYWQGSDRRI